MQISEIIAFYQSKLNELGDIQVYYESDDGRSTWASKYQPNLVNRKIWPKHPEPAHWYIEHKGY